MNTRSRIARLALVAFAAAFAGPVASQEPTQSLPTVRADAVLHIVDCDKRSLPSQREVGEWLGQHNFSQVYDSRKRLMADIGRNCQKSGIDQVQVVSSMNSARGHLRLVAFADRRAR